MLLRYIAANGLNGFAPIHTHDKSKYPKELPEDILQRKSGEGSSSRLGNPRIETCPVTDPVYQNPVQRINDGDERKQHRADIQGEFESITSTRSQCINQVHVDPGRTVINCRK